MMLWVLFAVMSAAVIAWIIAPLKADKKIAIAMIGLITSAALGVYLMAGSWHLEGQGQEERLTQSRAPLAMAARLENHLAELPDDSQAWHLLASLYMMLGDHWQASEAYHRARSLAGDTPDLLAGQAQAIIFHNDGVITKRARQMLERAHRNAPDNITALYFLAVAAKMDGDKARAAKLWRNALKIARRDKDHDWQRIIRRQINALKSQ